MPHLLKPVNQWMQVSRRVEFVEVSVVRGNHVIRVVIPIENS